MSTCNPENKSTFLNKCWSLSRNFFPLLIWNYIKPKIGEVEFISTFKFSVGVTAFPLFYLAQASILAIFFGSVAGWTYFGLSLLSVWLLTKSK